MKLKQRDWVLIGIVVIIIALVWRSGGFKEGMTGVLPLTKSDVDNNTAAAQQVKSKLISIQNSLGYTDVNIGNSFLYGIVDIMQLYPITPPTKDDLAKLFGTKIGLTTYAQMPDEFRHPVDITYQYFNGSTPSVPSSSSTPSPASSSSTQPSTIGVPSPCRPSYKSIPGGSMEFKCFS